MPGKPFATYGELRISAGPVSMALNVELGNSMLILVRASCR